MLTTRSMYGIKVFVNINRMLYYYRTNMESITNMSFSDRKFGILKAPDAIREFLRGKTAEYDRDVDYYEMRHNIQLYNNAIQAGADSQYADRLDTVYRTLMKYLQKDIGIDPKYQALLRLLKCSRPLYRKMILRLR